MKLYVWDFHGVLEKDNEIAVMVTTNIVCREFGVRELTPEENILLYGKRWIEYFRHVSPDSSEEDLAAMNARVHEVQNTQKPYKDIIKPQDYAHEVLHEIEHRDHTNILMSNCQAEALDSFLETVGMSNSFSAIYAADTHTQEYPLTKDEWLTQYLKPNKFDGLVVIDDIIVGIERGLRFDATTYHFRRDGKFKDSPAHHKITDLRDILKR